MSVKITWHGHGTFSLDVNGTKIVVDPFLKGNSPVAQVSADEVDADYVLLTHAHGDHIADALPIATRCGATVISNFEIVNWVMEQGHDKAHPQHLGGGFQHPFGHVKMTTAFHGSSFPDGRYGGMPGGFLLTVDGKKIYIAGDTALFSDMELIGRGGLDVAILPIGDNFTMGPEDSILAINYLKPNVVIPCHFGTFPPIEVDIEAWEAQVKADTEAEPMVLEIEGSYEL